MNMANEDGGESDAVDEFIKDKDIDLKAIRNSFQPTAYIVKK